MSWNSYTIHSGSQGREFVDLKSTIFRKAQKAYEKSADAAPDNPAEALDRVGLRPKVVRTDVGLRIGRLGISLITENIAVERDVPPQERIARQNMRRFADDLDAENVRHSMASSVQESAGAATAGRTDSPTLRRQGVQAYKNAAGSTAGHSTARQLLGVA